MWWPLEREDRADIVRKACPGPGACGGMYTANTMATATEATCIIYYTY